MLRSRPLLAATIGFGVLFVAAQVALGAPPDPDLDPAALVGWVREHRDRIRLWVWLLTLAAPFFAVYAALVRARLPSPHRDVFFFGAVALSVETACMTWLWAGLAWHADGLEPATTRLVVDVASYWGPVLISATVTLLSPVVLVALRADGVVPRWVGWLGAVVLVEQLVETITIFGKGGFVAPGGAMNTLLGAVLFGVFLVCLGIALGRQAVQPAP